MEMEQADFSPEDAAQVIELLRSALRCLRDAASPSREMPPTTYGSVAASIGEFLTNRNLAPD